MSRPTCSTGQTALEQSFADICAKHGLSCLGVNYHPTHEGTHFSTYAHAVVDGVRFCGSGVSDNLGQSISGAIANLRECMFPAADATLADEALPIGEAA